MPLVVPGINSSMGDKSEWANKLMGKTISNTTNETARRHTLVYTAEKKVLADQENPKFRLNIHVNEEGAVHDVNYG
ncbi:hypothetical protein N7475_001051 [Penicillium sp. IBT 31633x]|nr:hypothetical protein N7475_001051 [Penicillium sp. IBT 31633x]